jgi:hypothetical protein
MPPTNMALVTELCLPYNLLFMALQDMQQPMTDYIMNLVDGCMEVILKTLNI